MAERVIHNHGRPHVLSSMCWCEPEVVEWTMPDSQLALQEREKDPEDGTRSHVER